MSKELRFRAWDADNKDMFHFRFDDVSAGQCGENDSYLSNCVVMQYTGLLDKNGKEIYEGDILAGSPSWECQVARVQWQSGGFVKWGLYSSGWTDTPLNDGLSRFEVIGNIHEHPELFKP